MGIDEINLKKEELILGAGVWGIQFDPSDIDSFKPLFSTRGGTTITVAPVTHNIAVDNVPEQAIETLVVDYYDVKAESTTLNANEESFALLGGFADIIKGDGENSLLYSVKFRNDIRTSDFKDLFFISKVGYDKLGVYTIKNCISMGGFSIKFNDKGEGEFKMSLQGSYSVQNVEDVPFEYNEYDRTWIA